MRLALGLWLILLCSCASIPNGASKQALTTQELANLTASGEEENASNPQETATTPAFHPLADMNRPVEPAQRQPFSTPPPPMSIFQQSNTIFQSR
jgi:hypothetical protein